MESMLTQWQARYDINDVINYVTKVDAIILLGNSTTLRKIIDMCTRNERKELTKLLKSYIYKR